MLKTKCVLMVTALALLGAMLPAQDKALPSGFVRGSQVIGMDVRNAANENLGDIEDVVLDRNTGSISYAVLSFGGFLEMGDKLFAVPWSSLKASSDGKFFTLDVPKDKLKGAPGFDKNNWPNLADPKFRSDLNTFWGVTATTPALRRDETGMAEDGLRRDQPRQPADDAIDGDRRDFDRPPENTGLRADDRREDLRPMGAAIVRTGRVRSFTRNDPAQLVIATNSGDFTTDLAPLSFIDQQRLVFDNDANVTVRGFETMRNGRTTFVATEVTMADGRVVQLRRDDLTPLWTESAMGANTHRGTTQYNGNLATGTTSALHDVSGTILHIESGACESAYGRLVTIRTDAGDRVIALGPGSNLDRHNWALRQNDTIFVRGYDFRPGDRTYFIATEVRRGNDTLRLRSDDGTPQWTR